MHHIYNFHMRTYAFSKPPHLTVPPEARVTLCAAVLCVPVAGSVLSIVQRCSSLVQSMCKCTHAYATPLFSATQQRLRVMTFSSVCCAKLSALAEYLNRLAAAKSVL